MTRRVSDPDRRSCARCGFTVQARNERGELVPHLIELLEQHLVECPSRPSAELRRKLRRAVTKPWIAKDPKLAMAEADRILREA